MVRCHRYAQTDGRRRRRRFAFAMALYLLNRDPLRPTFPVIHNRNFTAGHK